VRTDKLHEIGLIGDYLPILRIEYLRSGGLGGMGVSWNRNKQYQTLLSIVKEGRLLAGMPIMVVVCVGGGRRVRSSHHGVGPFFGEKYIHIETFSNLKPCIPIERSFQNSLFRQNPRRIDRLSPCYIHPLSGLSTRKVRSRVFNFDFDFLQHSGTGPTIQIVWRPTLSCVHANPRQPSFWFTDLLLPRSFSFLVLYLGRKSLRS
jgi:hypothetical protein